MRYFCSTIMGCNLIIRLTIFCFLFLSVWGFSACAQQDSLSSKDKNVLNPVDPKTVNPFLPDSVIKQNRQTFFEDSIARLYLAPASSHGNVFIDSILKPNEALFLPAVHSKKRDLLQPGKFRNSRSPWVVAVAIGLLIFTALLNFFMGNDVKSVIQSFYNKHALSQTDKEGGLINSWLFLGLFLLFSLTTGLVLYQVTQYYGRGFGIGGFQLFVYFSVGIALLLALKFFILKFIGFIFDIGGVVSQYVAVLNLTYFNVAFILLGVAICFCLMANQFIPILLTFTLGAIGIIFAWQYLRNSLSIISDFRFHKFYLFIYLCALEICPILVLIKALSI